MIDLGSMTDKFSEAGQNVVRRAIEVSKSRDHNSLRWYSEKIEAETILRILKSITGRYAQKLIDSA